MRGEPEERRRHAARAVAAGAEPRRPARSRRAARRLRGGARDCATCSAGRLPRELARRLRDQRCRVTLAEHLDAALGDELPLLKRDGGFVRAGYDAELDEMRALRDESRKRDRRAGARR